jgi:hypothetical protein
MSDREDILDFIRCWRQPVNEPTPFDFWLIKRFLSRVNQHCAKDGEVVLFARKTGRLVTKNKKKWESEKIDF